MTAEPIATVDELLAAYADDPAALSADERAAVEARLAADPAAAREVAELRALLGDLRAHGDVADRGPDWSALEANVRAAIAPAAAQRSRWLAGAGVGVVLAAAAALALWWQRRDDGPGLDVARLVAVANAPVHERPVAPVPGPDDPRAIDAVDGDGALALDELDDLGAGGDVLGDDEVDEEVLIGRALERVPEATDDDGLFPGLDTEWVDDLSATEVEQALRWLDQQGAG